MTSIYPPFGTTHWYRLRQRDPLSDVTAVVCDCGYVSEWMLTLPAAQGLAAQHLATSSTGVSR